MLHVAQVLCYPAATALVAAIFLPNVEFIFGLAGSTASVLIAYIMPAAIFLITSSVVTQPVGTFSQGDEACSCHAATFACSCRAVIVEQFHITMP